MGGPSPTAPGLRIRALGGLSLSLDGRPVTDLVSRRTEAVLVYLACARRPQSREALADLLWDERGQTQAAGNLRVVVNSLRRSLGPFIQVDRYTIGVNPASDFSFDVADFETAAQAALRDANAPDRELLFRAAGLYRGEFLAGLSLPEGRRFEEWAMLERERLRRLQIQVLDALVDAAGRDRHYRAGIDLAMRLLQIDPLRESAHRQLMRLHARLGQRSNALAQYQACERVLRDELDVLPDTETRALAERIRAATRPWTIAPPQTPFVGRRAELARIAQHLTDPRCRLLTVAGIGGSGKTRLASEAARLLAPEYLNGALFVPLAEAATADDLVTMLLAALETPSAARTDPRAQLRAGLRDKELLLVLDNVEQVAGAAAEIAELLDAAPDLKCVVTSRQRLDLRAEWLLALGGLNDDDAAELFMQCAARSHPHVALAPDGAARISRLVEGNPLAIELAAAWVGENSVEGIAEQIATSLDVLATRRSDVPDRHRSLRVVFEQSWQRLGARERDGLARLSVFSGGFESEAARIVAGADRRALAELAEHSLLRRAGPDRFEMHALVRQYASERLPQPDRAAAAHAAYYTGLLRRLDPELKGFGQLEALRAIDTDIANVRAAWTWAALAASVGQPAAGAALDAGMGGLSTYYWLRSWFHEGAAAFARAATAVEARPDTGPDHQRLLGGLLAQQAHLSEFTTPSSDIPAGLYQRSLDILRKAGAESATALPLFGLAYIAHMRGQFEQARRDYEASLNLYRDAGDRWGMASVLSNLCLTLRRQGQFGEAARSGLESLAIRREIGDQRGIASSLNNLALVRTATGDYADAASALEESIALCRAIGHPIGVANALTTLVQVAHASNDRATAIRHQRDALEVYRELGDGWGVAIACNNLGQLALEGGDLNEADARARESAALYRQMGMRTGLANALSNLGQVAHLRGDTPGAIAQWGEALSIARDNGDIPIGLEIMTRLAGSGALPPDLALRLAAFAQRQPELLAETRGAVNTLLARLSVDAPAAPGAGPVDFASAAAAALAALGVR